VVNECTELGIDEEALKAYCARRNRSKLLDFGIAIQLF